uniref:Uncharacterized protein n=1 Tax=Utricularia reniformis TaxID=192314 RepID=A0A1Y0AZS4_9LAMI|nr:hypothetical protein AEK19_MT0359 [Utricularia reniformis]ART30631.1 hypothetical protein AEK19_MT0359 [Utricularia reniformis]
MKKEQRQGSTGNRIIDYSQVNSSRSMERRIDGKSTVSKACGLLIFLFPEPRELSRE